MGIQTAISKLEQGDELLVTLARGLRKKFDKNWGKFNKINQLLLFASILDPRYKVRYMEFSCDQCYPKEEVKLMIVDILAEMSKVYGWYEKNSNSRRWAITSGG